MECPHCHEECDEIYQCRECDMMFCDNCKADIGIVNALTMGMDEQHFGPMCPKEDGRGVSITSEEGDE